MEKNNLSLFKGRKEKLISKNKVQLAAMKKDINVFSQFDIGSQFEDGDLDEFF